jgi:hypothetical protein
MLARFGAAMLSDAISRISYPGLDLSRVKPLGSITATTRHQGKPMIAQVG